MGLFDQFREQIERRAARNSIRELRKLREVLEIGIDSYRQVNGLPTAFGKPMFVDAPLPGGVEHGKVIRPGEYQTIWFLEELAAENHIPLTAETDLEALALERGWMSPEGQLLMLPLSAKGMEVEGGVWLK